MKFLLTLVLVCNIALAKDFNTTPQPIETINTPDGYKLESFDKRYTFAIPKAYTVKRADTEVEFLMISSKGKMISSISEWPASNKLLFNADDFGLKGNRGQVLIALYDQNITTNKEINKFREEIFKISTNVQVFKRGDFIFYQQTRVDKGQIELTISNLNNDDIIGVWFLKGNEEFFMNFIKTFKSN
ncbi:MAG: hypothetical protein L3J59_02170 [Methylococcaceae bacterium]|nr:hypothetical protein [Methylococcaceae bacterium]